MVRCAAIAQQLRDEPALVERPAVKAATTLRLSLADHASVSRRQHVWTRDLRAPLALALGLRLLLLMATEVEPSWDGVIYERAAGQLAQGEGYTLRILAEANDPLPTAYYPVGFPALLAFVRLAGGELLADRLLQVFACTLFVPLAYLFARRASTRSAGVTAAWLAAAWPGGIFLSATWLAEPLFAVGIALALLPLAYARRRERPRALAIAALGLGLTAYIRASALAIAGSVALALALTWLRGWPWPKRLVAALATAAAVLAIASLPLTPWLIRNQQQLGAPVLVSTNGGVNLLIGALGDGSFAPLDADEPCRRPSLSEVARSRCYQRQALAVIAADPLAWLGRAGLKLAHTFGHDSASAQCFVAGLRASEQARARWRVWSLALCRLGWLVLLCGTLVGAFLVFTRGPPTMRALLLAPIAGLAGLHMVYLSGDRYHAAVAPMMLALAGVAVTACRRGGR